MDSLANLAAGSGVSLKILSAAREVNQEFCARIMKKINSAMGSVEGKQVGLLGLAFKPNTNSVVSSGSIRLARSLMENGAHVKAYDPTSTPADAALVRAEHAVYKRNGIDPIVMPRLAGSWPGYVFTGDPLRLPAGHFGLGHGSGAHAPNEYYVIESSNPQVKGIDDAVMSYVEYLYEVAGTA
jgi:hypothetical protein